MIVVLAEKPSVAREIASVVGATARCDGFLEGNGYRVTWAIGHLVGLPQPADIEPAWARWDRATLPMLPKKFPLTILESGKRQYRVVERLLRDHETQSLIAATDAGREGELIFRYIYERAGCTKPWQRLWLSSMTVQAIRNAFARLEPGSRYDDLAAAARARSEADWLVGMNLSRAYTLTSGKLYSVGRVQTPTLAMIVERDERIRRFVPEPYLEVSATFESDRGVYRGTYFEPPTEGLRDASGRLRPFQAERTRLPADPAGAEAIAAAARSGVAAVAELERSVKRAPPPQLYDLSELQRDANRIYGLSAQHTLDAAQALYEKHKALSYPRTDSHYLSTAVAATLPEIIGAVSPLYTGLVAAGSGAQLGKRWIDDSKVRDHHALIPTSHRPSSLPPNTPESRIYDLVCRRLLMAWHPELEQAVTRVVTRIDAQRRVNGLFFATQGTEVVAPGWTVLQRRPRPQQAPSVEESGSAKVPAGLAPGAPQRVVDASVVRKQTQPPKVHTEATLLSAMETAGRQVTDESVREAMRETGLGTPATRAATIETLLGRGYLQRAGKALTSTELGRALVQAVHPLVRSPEMTGRWEQRLARMERGEDKLEPFLQDIMRYVQDVVAAEASKPVMLSIPRSTPRPSTSSPRRRGRRSSRASGSTSHGARHEDRKRGESR